ncbi:MAG: class I SAM-dependent methyltransferase [Phormidium sp. PBR-2020]|nr:MAG: class I SAM-dependent methyltransferase [Phormidium sp. PBR-2020]
MLREALDNKLRASMALEGTLQLPCLPALATHYEQLIVSLLDLLGQSPTAEELAQLRSQFRETLNQGFKESPRRYLNLSYQLVNPAQGIAGGIGLKMSLTSPPEAQQSFAFANQSRFGRYPDAKAMTLAASLGEAAEVSVLDIGAGIGRNSLPLAKRGHPVAAVVTNSEAAKQLQEMADSRNLSVHLLPGDFLDNPQVTGDYHLAIAPEVLPHLRSPQAMAHFFGQSRRVLAPTGRLLVGAFLAKPGYIPEAEVQELAQACGCSFLTQSELEDILEHVGFRIESQESVVAYESTHLPAAAWLPSESFLTWATGQELFPGLINPPVAFYWLCCVRKGNPSKADRD